MYSLISPVVFRAPSFQVSGVMTLPSFFSPETSNIVRGCRDHNIIIKETKSKSRVYKLTVNKYTALAFEKPQASTKSKNRGLIRKQKASE